MEITREMLESFSADDLEKIAEYTKILEEAKEAVNTIKAAYTFRMGEDKISVSNGVIMREWLWHEGVWITECPEYKVKIDVDSVFQTLKEDDATADHFRKFVKRANGVLERSLRRGNTCHGGETKA